MEKEEIIKVDTTVKAWLSEARDNVLRKMDNRLEVDTKSGRKDLVTNIDKANERFLVSKIRQFDSEAKILGEEGSGDEVRNTDGRVWIIDPIDGTMNFVKQRNHFAIMISLYEDGEGILGYILDVINNELVSGGPSVGVTINGHRMEEVPDTPLKDGLIGLSGPMVLNDNYHMQEIAHTSMGMRIYGSAGIEMISVFKGEQVGYISYLKPWDFGAGRIIAETLGMKITSIDGKPLGVLLSNAVLLATKNAHQDILTIVKK
ncbi:inositol monophosphatase family protein [Lentilactobacillus sp. Marseille-Q4993]|uniref:inositol monophosphatase family protein n=1 Tax=Lentilactobacillus sp. Marseille-Q4993 TaxID=3039492 RepID=UPI0024BC5ABD|nr:inositol monophosphatase family protein [Lentilactobacillus sp. Marseille-Q4993]